MELMVKWEMTQRADYPSFGEDLLSRCSFLSCNAQPVPWFRARVDYVNMQLPLGAVFRGNHVFWRTEYEVL